MPTYEYLCKKCGKFETFQKITQEALESCPKCDGPVKRLISSGAGIIFKGSGFYSTDYKSGNGHLSSKKTTDSSDKKKTQDKSSEKKESS